MIKPKTKQALNALFFHGSRIELIQHGNCLLSEWATKTSIISCFFSSFHHHIKVFVYYDLQTISSKGSLNPSFSPANKAIPITPWRALGFYFQVVPMQAHLKPGGGNGQSFLPFGFISYFQARDCQQWSTPVSTLHPRIVRFIKKLWHCRLCLSSTYENQL